MGSGSMWKHQLSTAGVPFTCDATPAADNNNKVCTMITTNSSNNNIKVRLSPEELAALLVLPRSSSSKNNNKSRASTSPSSSLSRSGSIRHRDGPSRRHSAPLTLDAHIFEQQRGHSVSSGAHVGWGMYTEKESSSLCYMTMPIKPPYSYATLIKQALAADDEINRTKGGKTLQEIYQWIEDHYCYYRPTDIAHDGASSSWKSSVRHNLAFGECFKKTIYHVAVCDDDSSTDNTGTATKQSRPQRKRGNRLRKCTVWSLVTDADQQFRSNDNIHSDSTIARVVGTISAGAASTQIATPPVQRNKSSNNLLKRALTNFEPEFSTSSSTLASRAGSITGSETSEASSLPSPVLPQYRALGRSDISITNDSSVGTAQPPLHAAKRQCINEWRTGSVAPSFASKPRASADTSSGRTAAAEMDVNAHFVRALLSSNSLYDDEWPQQLPSTSSSQSLPTSEHSVAVLASRAREPTANDSVATLASLARVSTTADCNKVDAHTFSAALTPLNDSQVGTVAHNNKPEQSATLKTVTVKSESDTAMFTQPDFPSSVDFLQRIGRMHVGSGAHNNYDSADNNSSNSNHDDLGRRFMIRTPSATTTSSSTGSTGCGARELSEFFSACAWDTDAFHSLSPGSLNIDPTSMAAMLAAGNTALGMTGVASSPSTLSTGALDIACTLDTEDVLVDYIAKSLAAMQ